MLVLVPVFGGSSKVLVALSAATKPRNQQILILFTHMFIMHLG